MNKEFDFERPIVEIESKIEELSREETEESKAEIERLQQKAQRLRQKVFTKLSPWQRVQVARHQQRPGLRNYIDGIFEDFLELHGDRLFGDDPAIVTGLAKIDGLPVILIGNQKGKDTTSNLACNFGMPHPEGYRKARRVMELAQRFHKPIITLIDTPGAYPGIGAEERGQGEAIASNLAYLSRLFTPIIVVIIGEGGSGGALAIGVGDRILMLENAIYSVISPEGCAAILWNDESKAEEAAGRLKLTSKDLLRLNLIDEIIPEPVGGAHRDYDETFERLKEALLCHLRKLQQVKVELLVAKRYEKFRKMGRFLEESKE
ncbi:TPA: acetyl-CoA carboxylase carboxyl transferase subunit alpha [bacterium]|nr:acetyl-CoA carboxylase carboxyl transferase subunit alpha [bacterium]